MTEKTIIANINNLMDNWDSIKNIYTPGYFSNNNGRYKFNFSWYRGQVPAITALRVAFPSFEAELKSDCKTIDNIKFVVKVGYYSGLAVNLITSDPELSISFEEVNSYTGYIPNKYYEYINIDLFDEYAYYSFLSSVIWKLRLGNCIATNLTEEHFDYCLDSYIYVFLTGEEADYDKLSEEKKALVDLKKEEAKMFLRTLHSSIVETLKQIFKENS